MGAFNDRRLKISMRAIKRGCYREWSALVSRFAVISMGLATTSKIFV
jgi:hypothetical protein